MPEDLVRGFKIFRLEKYEGANPLMPKLVKEGQDPRYFIISCIDSRSNTGTIFKTAPGTFFGHNAMGAIVRPYKQGTALAAALQFAIKHNQVKNIIVLGHTGCGAIKALIDGIEDDEISSFVEVADKAFKHAKACCPHEGNTDEIYRATEEQMVLESIENLKTYPCVAEALEKGEVTIKPWLFDMENGTLLEYCEDEKNFIDIINNDRLTKDA